MARDVANDLMGAAEESLQKKKMGGEKENVWKLRVN